MSEPQSQAADQVAEFRSARPLAQEIAATSYLLDLGTGLSWCVSGSDRVQPILKKLAGIFRMQPGYRHTWPHLLLGSDPAGFRKCDAYRDFPAEGWTAMPVGGSRIWSHTTAQDVCCDAPCYDNPNGFFLAWTSMVHAIYRKVIENGGVPIHGALIERGGVGVALAGASGRGKSTCCSRLADPWRALSDDTTLVMPARSKGFCARPFPTWGDMLRHDGTILPDVRHVVPLAGLFFLEQTASDEVLPLGKGEAAAKIYASASQIFGSNLAIMERAEPGVVRVRLFDNACRLSSAVKTFVLGVSLTGQFWDKIDNTMY